MTAPTLEKPAPALERRTSDWERHAGHGGPKVLPPPGVEWRSASGKSVQRHRYYTRVTTLAKAIDDTSKLMAWKMRGVLVGLGQRPAYVVAAAGLTLKAEDRAAGDELAEKALQAAQGDDAALVGTALHTFTERLDRGEPLGHVPEQLRPLLEAYRQLTAPLTFAHREVRMVCDDLEAAGTPDALGWCSIPDPDGVVDDLRVIDLKSGKVAYPGPMSIQLATYGRSDLYDPATGERTPVELNQRWGLIVHVQQDGEVPPGLYWLNLQHGNEGVELCRLVRSWRKVKPQAILRPVAEVTAPDAVDGLRVDDTVVVEQEPEPEPITAEQVTHAMGVPASVAGERGACATCGRDVSLIVPRGGDGSLLVTRQHGPRADPCAGSGEPPAAAELSPANSTAVESAGELQPATVPSEQDPEPAEAPEQTTEQPAPAPDEAPEQVRELPQEDDEAAADGTDAIVCGRGGAPTAADLETVARFGEFLETAGPPPTVLDAMSEDQRLRLAVTSAVTTADLDQLWRQNGVEWPAELVELATARHAELQRAESLARPRAALAAALRTASAQELHKLWTTHGQGEVWTEQHSELARQRHAELTAAA